MPGDVRRTSALRKRASDTWGMNRVKRGVKGDASEPLGATDSPIFFEVKMFRRYHKYQGACPASAALADQIVASCLAAGHQFEFNWPENQSQLITTTPNYFAFGTINTQQAEVVLDLRPSNWNYFDRPFIEFQKHVQIAPLARQDGDSFACRRSIGRVVTMGRGLSIDYGPSKFAQVTITTVNGRSNPSRDSQLRVLVGDGQRIQARADGNNAPAPTTALAWPRFQYVLIAPEIDILLGGGR